LKEGWRVVKVAGLERVNSQKRVVGVFEKWGVYITARLLNDWARG
jgi:uncharacterized membrane protein YecN with MAPEG domain